MASPTRCTWVWVDSGSWWWTGRPGMLRFMGLQRVGYHWVTELNWYTYYIYYIHILCYIIVTSLKNTSRLLYIILSTTNWHLPRAFAICFCGDGTLYCCSCWPSTHPEGSSGWRIRHFVLQGNWWNRSSDRYFQELISWSQSLHLLQSRKALNP